MAEGNGRDGPACDAWISCPLDLVRERVAECLSHRCSPAHSCVVLHVVYGGQRITQGCDTPSGIYPIFRCAGWLARDQIMFHREESGGGAGGDADLVVDVLDVVLGRFGGDRQAPGDFLIRVSLRDEAQHLDFPIGQP